ncbi:MAG: hypothetical protein CMJ89_03185 [Planctomycetes bacterium]|jgi:cytochrome c biogenesis protein CcdA/DsbC/DsbD-like thiol-disulfide interchange protein|nr:hypothetical protein [Planctomycetota bacterium]
MKLRRPSLLAHFLVLASLGGLLTAQATVEATLYTRVEDSLVRAAIEIEIEPGWHLYHNDLGHPNAIGQKTTVELSGKGIEWGEVWFPEPITFDQSDIEKGVYILGHEDSITLYALGKLAPDIEGATGKDVRAKLKGLVCEVSCKPYMETVASSGKGDDSLFNDFPEELLSEARQQTEPKLKRPLKDEHSGGRADSKVYSRVRDGWVRVAIEISIDFGFHLYHTEKGNEDGIGKKTTLALHGEGIDWQEPIWPEPHEIDQSDIEDGLWIYGHDGDIVVYARGALKPGATGDDVWIEIKGQTCDDEACINYTETAVSKGEGPDALFKDFPEPDAKEKDGLITFLMLAVFWGFFTLLMPCTYPMIPITISFFTKQAVARGGKVLPLSLTYGAGIVAIFIVIGVAFGSVIIPFATHWLTNLIIGVLFLYFAFVLFGVIDMQPPKFMMRAAGKAQTTGGYFGVFLMGATLVVTSFTCTAPFVGSLLSVGAADGDLGRIVLGMGTFGLTMAIPFVLLSLVPGRIQAMPKSGEWMNTLKFFLGFVEIAAAFKFLSNTDLVLGWNILSREVFLLLWGVIFTVAALYLFGVLFKSHGATRSPKRMVSGVLTLAFAVYCLTGFRGREMDYVMTAVIPPYSWSGESDEISWVMVENDYDSARELALKGGKKLFLNFTGYT